MAAAAKQKMISGIQSMTGLLRRCGSFQGNHDIQRPEFFSLRIISSTGVRMIQVMHVLVNVAAVC